MKKIAIAVIAFFMLLIPMVPAGATNSALNADWLGFRCSNSGNPQIGFKLLNSDDGPRNFNYRYHYSNGRFASVSYTDDIQIYGHAFTIWLPVKENHTIGQFTLWANMNQDRLLIKKNNLVAPDC